MRTYRQEFTNYTIVFDDGSSETMNFTPIEWAALKRSNRWKKRVAHTKNFSVEIITKFPDNDRRSKG